MIPEQLINDTLQTVVLADIDKLEDRCLAPYRPYIVTKSPLAISSVSCCLINISG